MTLPPDQMPIADDSALACAVLDRHEQAVVGKRVPVPRSCGNVGGGSRTSVQVGASPRGSLALMLTSRAYAVIAGDYVVPEDVKAVAHPVLDHRISLRPELWISEEVGHSVVEATLGEVPVPAAREQGTIGLEHG